MAMRQFNLIKYLETNIYIISSLLLYKYLSVLLNIWSHMVLSRDGEESIISIYYRFLK